MDSEPWDYQNQRPLDMTVQIELQAIQSKAKKAAIFKVVQQGYESLMRSDQFEEFQEFLPLVEKYKEHKTILSNLGDPILKEFKCVWITISPEAIHGFDEDPTKFQQIIHNWLRKCSKVVDYTYVIEQRSETTDNFYGVHAHILILTDAKTQPYTRWIEWVKRTFNPYVGTTFQWFMKNKKGAIYFKDLDFVQGKILYMKGEKTGEHKQALCASDVEFRKKHALLPMYSSAGETDELKSTVDKHGIC